MGSLSCMIFPKILVIYFINDFHPSVLNAKLIHLVLAIIEQPFYVEPSILRMLYFHKQYAIGTPSQCI